MKQILQSARSGELRLLDVPAPTAGPGQILVQNHFSVVSPGTEKLAIDFASKSLLGKARSRPDLVSEVVRKLQQEGPLPTYRTVVNRLDSPQPLGYSSAGIVLEVGEGVDEYRAGDRVACAGAGYANHAEIISVPENLSARVPNDLGLDQAAYATIGSIALQGVRISDPTLGEVAVVVGLGLIGQLAVQLLAANGCRVLGVDIDERRIAQAINQGAEWGTTPEALSSGWQNEATQGYGVDFALVTASSNDAGPIELSANLCRPKGRVIVVGAMPLELDRRTFYEKELELRLSMSYGPGRYDRRYEESGVDYPLPYVRWTEKRNLQTFLDLARQGRINPGLIDSETVNFEASEAAYAQLAEGKRSSSAVVFRYQEQPDLGRTLSITDKSTRNHSRNRVGIGFLGAGHYAKSVLIPALGGQSSIERVSLVTATGASAKRSAERFGFQRCGTDPDDILKAEDVDLVFITTRHNLHARQAIAALNAGKDVWLEKPVGLTRDEVDEVAESVRKSGRRLVVGYNRRFSSHARTIRKAFSARQDPLSINYVIAAGQPPHHSWITDPAEGGGRIIGEVCHFVDLCTYLIGARPIEVIARSPSTSTELDDSVTSLVTYSDGSTATIQYLAKTSRELPKERFEVSGDGITALCENFKRTKILGKAQSRGTKKLNQDKGQSNALCAMIDSIRVGGEDPIPLHEIISTSRVTFAILECLRDGTPIRIAED